jgi:hypothetical protein
MEAEAGDAGLEDGSLFPGPVPDAIVLHEDHLAASASFPQPDPVVLVLVEEVVVCQHPGIDLAEPVRHLVPSEAPVAEELRLRCARARGA